MLLPSMNRFDPFKEFRDLDKRLHSMSVSLADDEGSGLVSFAPAVNTREGDYAFHVEVDLPGVKKDAIKVELKDNRLIISGERKTKDEKKAKDYYRVESQYGKFERSFTLPDGVDAENISANCEDGVLEVVIPKRERSTGSKTVKVT
ncbi:Hsp20/alpha crystallin family protein [Thiomicrorhabdus sediminis]|uniref:Hsp20/alpha crystallin family protein n=2 Tax=Thiomicrorhabdus sediminis TaxID=2580412 RepID=A0A4P9K9E3_9GAMM|nr:Hsp20/alpha crystallin family protein [Thiomicrorhabdus sediminis]